MSILLRQTWLEAKLFMRGLDNLFWTLAFPMFFIVLFGLIYGDTVMFEDLGVRAIDYLLPGIVVMALMITGIQHTAIGFTGEREKGIYRRLSLTPVRPWAILGGQILNRYFVMLVQTLILLVLGILAFGVSIVGSGLWIWLVLSVGTLCFLSIGFLLTGFVRGPRAAEVSSNIVFFTLLFLGGVFFPKEIMPDFLASFSRGLPSTLLNDALREVMILGRGIGSVWQELLGMGGWFVVSLLGAIKLFRWE